MAPITAPVKKTNCPSCGEDETIEVRTWQGAWVSINQGEALTNLHYRVDAICGCKLSQTKQIMMFHKTEAQK